MRWTNKKAIKIPPIIPVIAGIFLVGLLVYFGLHGCRFLGLLIFGADALLACYYCLFKIKKPAGKIMLWILSAILLIGFVAALITGIFIGKAEKGTQNATCDYLIVLGAGVNGTTPSLSLQERINAAYTYLAAHPDTVCIVSGGQGSGEDITEAQCMFSELTKMGIPEARIWLEDKADSTWKNILYSLDVIEAKTGTRPTCAGIVSSDYHLYRASLYAKEAGIEPVCIPAKTSWWHLHLNYFLREIFGVWAYYIF